MNDFMKSVRVLILVICIALFSVGIIWNLFYGTLPKETISQPTMGEISLDKRAPDTKVQEAQYTAEKMQAANMQKTDLATIKQEKAEKQPADASATEQQPSEEQTIDKQITNKQVADQDTTEVGLFPAKQTADTQKDNTETLANQLAALRMQRDSSWQQLKEGLEGLQFEQKQECLKRYEELQYKEQRLELLLKAKGVTDCLVLLEEQQANVIAGGTDVAAQYQKIYDLVQRNTDYGPEQIVIVPLTDKTNLANGENVSRETFSE